MTAALQKIRVLDFTRAVSGSLCTYLFRELGAEIIKVEIPGSGDSIRQLPPLTEGGEGYTGIILNRGKKGITLNLKCDRGHEIALELARTADIVVENFSPGIMEELGLGYGDIKKVNSAVIYASCSGFGRTGPRASEPAFDSVIQAAGGLMAVNGLPNQSPLRVGMVIADFLGGIYTAVAILAALHYRDKTGEGQSIDMSMQDIVWSLVATDRSPEYFLNGKIPERTGNRSSITVPSNNYPTQDGHVRIAASMRGQWDRLLRVIGREDLVGSENYSSLKQRLEHVDEVDALVENWTKNLTTAKIIEICQSADIPCTPIPTFDQVCADPQLLSREMIVDMDQPCSGKVKVPGTPFKMSQSQCIPTNPAPFLGEHNYEVFCGMLRYSEEQLRQLQDEGVI